MGYYIRELKDKATLPHWKVQYISYKKAEATSSTAKRPRKEWDIKKNRWQALGFKESMTFHQAQTRAKQLNAQIESRRQEERRYKIEQEQLLLNQKFTANLPQAYKDEFEIKYLNGRFQKPGWKKRFFTSWRAAQKMLLEVELDPIDWYDEAYLFYDYFHKNKFSYSYIKKILLVTNLWGHFLSKRLGQSFIKIPMPRGCERARLIEAYYEKCGNRLKQSEPITPEQLFLSKPRLKAEYYNWLHLSVWLGLRPQEVDQLKEEKYVRLQSDVHGNPILWIYQTKLVSVPPRYRWKLIPIIFKEQAEALCIIQSRLHKRPPTKTMKKLFGPNTTLYGGRKGFTDLMLSHEQEFVHISQWMGHSSIERTWKNYKSKQVTHYNLRKTNIY